MNSKLKNAMRPFRIALLSLAVFLVLSPFLAGCQRRVEKEKMEAIAQWSIAMCKCAEMSDAAEAKKCAEALEQPRLELLNSSGHTKYKLDSVHVYDQIEGTGVKCRTQIMGR